MIQRIQTVWLLLAALTAAGVFFTDLFRAQIIEDTVAVTKNIDATGEFVLLLVAIPMVLLPLVAIFMFRNRKKQRGMVWIGFLVTVGFIALSLMIISNYKNDPAIRITSGSYHIGSVLPVVSLFFLILAIRGINRDEKLVRSLDRLR